MALITISQLNNYMKRYIEQNIHLSDIWLKGEISNFKKHYSGHIYMTLKDESSSVKAVIFNSYSKNLTFIPTDGDKVIVYGKIGVYERDGVYQVYVESMIPDGIGELYASYEKLKKQLDSQGLFDIKYKKSIPTFPKCIGVITSVSGAALRDIMNVITRRYKITNVCIYPVKVQGIGASDTICEALNFFSQHPKCDVIILARGGGSIEDLWAFNEEKTARAIFECKKPVISGIGHETDYTIADFVSDVRAPTPSAAAEIATPSTNELIDSINTNKDLITRYVESALQMQEQRLNNNSKNVLTDKLNSYINNRRTCVELMISELTASFTKLNQSAFEKFASLSSALSAMNPKNVLKRGYSIISTESNNHILNPLNLKCGDKINVLFDKGIIKCNVQEVIKGETRY